MALVRSDPIRLCAPRFPTLQDDAAGGSQAAEGDAAPSAVLPPYKRRKVDDSKWVREKEPLAGAERARVFSQLLKKVLEHGEHARVLATGWAGRAGLEQACPGALPARELCARAVPGSTPLSATSPGDSASPEPQGRNPGGGTGPARPPCLRVFLSRRGAMLPQPPNTPKP